MKSTSHHTLLSGFVAALALLGGVAWLDWQHTARTQETAELVAHTHEVQANLNRLLSLIEDIETGARGFVVTGNPAFLEPFENGLKAVGEQRRKLEQLINDADLRARLSALEPLIAECIALSQRNVDLRQNSGFDAARQEVASGKGKDVMDKIRARFPEMDAREQALLDQRSAAARREASSANLISAIGTGLSFALLITVFALMLRENRLRRRSDAELDRFFTLSLDLLCIASADGYFKRISPAFTLTLGWSVEEILARPFLDFVHPDDRAATRCEVERQVVASEKVLQFENRYQHKDGSWRALSWNSVPQPGGLMYATARDVTERKQAEETIVQLNAALHAHTAQLEAANKELEAFSYSVSHDLRAPLRAVDGFSQAVLEDYGPQLPEEGRRDLETIREGAQQMGALIDDLLTFSRLSRAPLNKQEVSTGKLVRSVLDDLSSQQDGRPIDLRIGELPASAGDPALLKQVWTNLLSNALKYTQKREAAVVEVGCEATPEGNVFFVRDNGTGFDMRYADKLFGVFQRLHRAEEFEGTGVGLAIAHRIIHRHGGRVWAEAAVDRGATFYFTLEGDTKP
jgi:PAS domain S-box-containing protein